MAHTDTHPLPDDRLLAEVATALLESGHWGWIVDPQWRSIYMSDSLRRSFGATRGMVSVDTTSHMFGPDSVRTMMGWTAGPNTLDLIRVMLAAVGPWLIEDTPGGRDELRTIVAPDLVDAVDAIELDGLSGARSFVNAGTHLKGLVVDVPTTALRIRDADGRLAGTVIIAKPAPETDVLAALSAGGDLRHFERMQQASMPARRPAAILFADLESSSELSRRLSTANYFGLGRRLVRTADDQIVDSGGLVGRHVGDGIVAFFLAESCGSESAAAASCIAAARSIQAALPALAVKQGLAPEDLNLRFGLHWGSTLYVGQISSRGRSEITALGDEANEAARIEACATGGRILASKALVERLDADSAAALGLDTGQVTFTPLGDLPSATEKARRDAPSIAVCNLHVSGQQTASNGVG